MIPSRVKIAGKWWKVHRKMTPVMKREQLRGYVQLDSRNIYLNPRLQGRELLETYTHEVLHAALYGFGMCEEWEEQLVEFVDGRLVDALVPKQSKSRPKAARYRKMGIPLSLPEPNPILSTSR